MAHKIICIERECGSGGHIIGELVAKELGISYYDKNLLELAGQYGDISLETLKHADEKATNPFYYKQLYEGNENVKKGHPANETLFHLQRDVLRKIAAKEDCVIVGRCADVILQKQDVSMVNVFIYSPLEMRIHREMANDHLSRKQALALIRRVDKKRMNYYRYFTKREWGNPHNYDLTLNSGALGLEKCVSILCDYYRNQL